MFMTSRTSARLPNLRGGVWQAKRVRFSSVIPAPATGPAGRGGESMTEEETRDVLRAIAAMETRKVFAARLGISQSCLSLVLRGRRDPAPLLRRLGFKRLVTYLRDTPAATAASQFAAQHGADINSATVGQATVLP